MIAHPTLLVIPAAFLLLSIVLLIRAGRIR